MKKQQPQTAQKAPKFLRVDTRKWWQGVVDEFVLEPHHLRLLTAAATSWDRACEARAAIEQHGLTFQDQLGRPVVRPEVAVERNSLTVFYRLLRELGLDRAAAPETVRPPQIAPRTTKAV